MIKRSEIEELEEKFEHLQERVDRLWEYVDKNPNVEYFWNKFEDLLAWSEKFDKNSKEYEILTKTGWKMLGHFLDIALPKQYDSKIYRSKQK